MRSLLPWLVKGVLSAAYWFGCYFAIGQMMGDRVVDGRIVAPAVPVPPFLLFLVAVALYAVLSFAWDSRRRRAGR